MERHFLLTLPLIFPVPLLVPHRAVLFMTSLSTVIHNQPLLLWNILSVIRILLINRYLKREEYIT